MKEYLKKNKTVLINHFISIVILLLGFVLCRYVFFDIHGMKEFPLVLLVVGIIVMVISLLSSRKIMPFFISTGYIIGFVTGFIFQNTKMDANGVSVNNLWVIWAAVYLSLMVIGAICELLFKKYGSKVDWKNSKLKIVMIIILAVLVLWLGIGITDFALVHNYKMPLFCIGINTADDGGSGEYAGLGYSFDIEGNFMPEATNKGITSYRGYIFGKEVSRGFWERMEVLS